MSAYSRRSVRALVMCLCAGTFLADPTESKPNILFIMADDHAVRAISAYDPELIHTPNIDRIANEGVKFTNAFVSNSICSPSRAVVLTGKHSHVNGLRDNRDTFNGEQATFPKLLQQHGYETAIVGKWHLKSKPTGFDSWKILIDQGEYYSPQIEGPEGVVQYDGSYVTDMITELALEFLDNRDKTRPFALLYHHKAPHRNWMPAPKFLDESFQREYPLPSTFDDEYAQRTAAASQDMRIADLFLSLDMKLPISEYENEVASGGGRDREFAAKEAVDGWRAAYSRISPEQQEYWRPFLERIQRSYLEAQEDVVSLERWKYQRFMNDYLGTIRSIDENIGRVLQYLDDNGLSENTIVIYTSDQGFFLGEHGWYDKRFMYEESMRTPLLLRYPLVVEEGQIVDELVQNLDLAPTLLDFATVSIPADVQGLSLRPLVEDQINRVWRDALYYHYYEYPHGWHAVQRHYGIRTQRYKLIYYYDIGEWELYDLSVNPHELYNVYDDQFYVTTQLEMHSRLDSIRKHYLDVAN